MLRLDKTKKFEVLAGKRINPVVRYLQDGHFFNCGGYPVINGKVIMPGTEGAEEILAAEAGKAGGRPARVKKSDRIIGRQRATVEMAPEPEAVE